MVVNSFDLYLANRVQEKGQTTLDALALKTQKSGATIRRSLQTLNQYLLPEKQFVITEAKIINQMRYRDLIALIQNLSLSDFSTTPKERLNYFVCLCVLQKTVNLSQIYDELAVSQSTKKKDRSIFLDSLAKKRLTLTSLPGKGVTITGDEWALRSWACEVLMEIIEINEQGTITNRQANNPLQQLLFEKAAFLWQTENCDLLVELLANNNIKLNYTSTKFLYLYYLLTVKRIKNYDQKIEIAFDPLLPVKILPLFSSESENSYFGALLASLDNHGISLYQKNDCLTEISSRLISYIEERVLTHFYSRPILQQEISHYLYKSIIRNQLAYDFYDNKLDDVKKEFSFLYQLVEFFYVHELAEIFYLGPYQLATLTLIFREHVLKNKVSGRNRKKIVVVTNSAQEKSDFFAQQLSYHFDTEIVATINLHELYRLKHLQFDHLLTFSNRIATILNEEGYPNIKVNYYFHDEDLAHLNKRNFSSNYNRKLIAEQLSMQLEQIEPQNWAGFLKMHYPNFFV